MNPLTKCFRWSGIKHGKKTHGVSIEVDSQTLKARLHKQHIHVISIQDSSRFYPVSQHARLTKKQLLHFTRQLTTTINANIPLLSSLEMMINQHHPIPIQRLLLNIKQSIQDGSTLSSAMKMSHPYLQGNYADLIEIGEVSGQLPDCLLKLTALMERQQNIKSKIVKASIYPGFVLFTSIIVTYLMLTLVVPEFSKIYSSMNAELPAITNSLVNLSLALQSYGFYLLLLIIILITGCRIAYRKQPIFRSFIQHMLLKLPIIGSVLYKAEIARSMQTLFTCYSAGIPIMECLQMAQKSVATDKLSRVFKQISIDMESGQAFHFALSKQQWFPPDVEQILDIGENSGTLSAVFEKLANDYTEQVNDIVDNLGKVIEPVIVLFIGSLVGGIVIAMYLPIFNLMSLLG